MGKKYSIFDVSGIDKRIHAETKYDRFRWFAEWLEFEDTLTDIDDRAAFKFAVKEYGLKGVVYQELSGKALEYFNTKVRPELDRQHKRLDKGLWI